MASLGATNFSMRSNVQSGRGNLRSEVLLQRQVDYGWSKKARTFKRSYLINFLKGRKDFTWKKEEIAGSEKWRFQFWFSCFPTCIFVLWRETRARSRFGKIRVNFLGKLISERLATTLLSRGNFQYVRRLDHLLVIDLELSLPLADPPASQGSALAREYPRRWWSSRSTWQVSADGEKYALQRLTWRHDADRCISSPEIGRTVCQTDQ